MKKTRVLLKGAQPFNNDDLRLRNITDQDRAFYNHKIFIVTWQRAKTLQDVIKKLNLTKKQIVSKAAHLRNRWGISLKRFRETLSYIPQHMIKQLRRLCDNQIKPAIADIGTPDEFISFWAKARTLEEVAKRFNMSKDRASARASLYRKMYKIPLKLFNNRRHNRLHQNGIKSIRP